LNDKENFVKELSFEDSLAELEAIVDRLESGQGSLDDAITAYERGSQLKRHCQTKLDEARMKVEKIRLPEDGGNPVVSDFDE
jgi:exodeoxyribonuclease VII small subunit